MRHARYLDSNGISGVSIGDLGRTLLEELSAAGEGLDPEAEPSSGPLGSQHGLEILARLIAEVHRAGGDQVADSNVAYSGPSAGEGGTPAHAMGSTETITSVTASGNGARKRRGRPPEASRCIIAAGLALESRSDALLVYGPGTRAAMGPASVQRATTTASPPAAKVRSRMPRIQKTLVRQAS